MNHHYVAVYSFLKAKDTKTGGRTRRKNTFHPEEEHVGYLILIIS